jgi:hypothetical protein
MYGLTETCRASPSPVDSLVPGAHSGSHKCPSTNKLLWFVPKDSYNGGVVLDVAMLRDGGILKRCGLSLNGINVVLMGSQLVFALWLPVSSWGLFHTHTPAFVIPSP